MRGGKQFCQETFPRKTRKLLMLVKNSSCSKKKQFMAKKLFQEKKNHGLETVHGQ